MFVHMFLSERSNQIVHEWSWTASWQHRHVLNTWQLRSFAFACWKKALVISERPSSAGELSLKVIFVQFPILDPSPNWVAFNRSHLEFQRCQVEKPLPRYRSCFEATSENQCWDSLPDRLAPYMAILPVDLGVPYFHSNGF